MWRLTLSKFDGTSRHPDRCRPKKMLANNRHKIGCRRKGRATESMLQSNGKKSDVKNETS